MSNAYAIGAVTAVLTNLLQNGLKAYKIADAVGGEVTVTSGAPDRVDLTGDEDPLQLNLFLYQLTYNAGWRNVGMPMRNAQGERIDDNPLALNLHYLLTAYGPKSYYAEIILGHAMQLLHETTVLTRDFIRKTLNPAIPPKDWPKQFATSELADQIEQLKIVPEIFTTEQIWNLWSAIQARYRTTAAYQVTVALIDSSRPAKKALPVAARNLYAVPFERLAIDVIEEATGPLAPIVATSKLLVKGNGLRGEITQIFAGPIDLTSSITNITDTQIDLPLPAPLPAGMRAGVQTLQVVHQLKMGTPPVAHTGNESNAGAFILRPLITANAPTGVTSKMIDGVSVSSGKIKIDFNPQIGKPQRLVLLLNELNAVPNKQPRAFSFKAPAGNGVPDPNTETASVTFDFTNVNPGDYLVRVQVDGAESLLVPDGGGKYATPKVTIP